jgi:energy-coupling factor transport system substrate-specific component
LSRVGRKDSFFSAKQIVAMAVGTVLYAALTIPFNVLQVPGEGGVIAIRPAIAIPMLFGIIFGPIVGFFVGLIGNILSDFASFGALSWSREIGSGLLGAVPGMAYFVIKRTDWTKAKALAMVAALAIVASIVGIGFTTMTDYIFQTGLSTIASFYSEAGTDAVDGAILTPLLLYVYAKATTGHAR